MGSGASQPAPDRPKVATATVGVQTKFHRTSTDTQTDHSTNTVDTQTEPVSINDSHAPAAHGATKTAATADVKSEANVTKDIVTPSVADSALQVRDDVSSTPASTKAADEESRNQADDLALEDVSQHDVTQSDATQPDDDAQAVGEESTATAVAVRVKSAFGPRTNTIAKNNNKELESADEEEEVDNVSLSSQGSGASVFQISRDEGLERVRTTVTSLKKRENFDNEEAIMELLFLLNCTPNLDTKGGRDKRAKRYVDEMINQGVMDVIVRVTRKYKDGAMVAKKDDDLNYLCVTLCLSFVMNGSSLAPRICEEVQRTGYYVDMLKLLNHENMRPENNDNYRSTDGRYELMGNAATLILITLQICMQRLDLRDDYRSVDAVRIFDMYRKCENDVFKGMAELSFACVVTEREKDLMIMDEEAFTIFHDILDQALAGRNKTDGGSFDMVFQPDRIIDALNQLAVNDENKVKIAEHKFIPVYMGVLKDETSTEKELEVVTKALWLLAFKVKDKLKDTPDCIDGESLQFGRNCCIDYIIMRKFHCTRPTFRNMSLCSLEETISR